MNRPERVISDYLKDMLDAAMNAERFVKGLTFEEFSANDEKVYARCIRCTHENETRRSFSRRCAVKG